MLPQIEHVVPTLRKCIPWIKHKIMSLLAALRWVVVKSKQPLKPESSVKELCDPSCIVADDAAIKCQYVHANLYFIIKQQITERK